MREGTSTGARQPVLADVSETEATVLRLVQGGDGLCRVQGVPVFVPRTAPGDRIRLRIVDRRPGFARGETIEILAPGATRVTPPCRYYTVCGGCDLQHIDDSHQLGFKAEAALETLKRLGGLHELPPHRLLASPAWGYRARAQWHTKGEGEALELGYFARGGRELVAIDTCPVLEPRLEQEIGGVRAALRRVVSPPRRVEAACAGDQFDVAPPIAGVERGELIHEVLGRTLRYDARCFFQGNLRLLPSLVETAIGEARGQRAIDLFAGVGLFSLFLAQMYERVDAVETDSVAVRFARRNARLNQQHNIEVRASSAEGFLAKTEGTVDRVLVDPPRVGLSAAVRRALIGLAAPRLTYVSCDAPTLARDLRHLCQLYQPESLVLLDMFPQTAHLEAVVQLRLREAT